MPLRHPWLLAAAPGLLPVGPCTLEDAPLAEIMGRSLLALEVFNWDALDSAHMEELLHHGSPDKKARWPTPLSTVRLVLRSR